MGTWVLIIVLVLYMIIRDFIIAKKRRKSHILLKRISSKFDQLSTETKKQSKLFTQLLDILSETEDE